jgi:hypothetical protein
VDLAFVDASDEFKHFNGLLFEEEVAQCGLRTWPILRTNLQLLDNSRGWVENGLPPPHEKTFHAAEV